MSFAAVLQVCVNTRNDPTSRPLRYRHLHSLPAGCCIAGRGQGKVLGHGGVPKWLRERSAKPPFTGSNPVAACF